MSYSYAIQPVCRRFPSSQTVWDSTNLPFSCLLTPLGEETTSRSRLSGIAKCATCGAPHPSKETHFKPKSIYESEYILCYLCGKVSFVARNTKTTDETVFQLPLKLPPASTTASVVESLSASNCPLLWFLVLDNPSEVALALPKEIPSHVSVVILLVGQERIGIVDTGSSIPHIQHFDSSNNNNNDEDEQLLVDTIRARLRHPIHWESARRALLDYPQPEPSPVLKCVPRVVHVVLEALIPLKKCYAGGKLTFVLGSLFENQVGWGGWGGKIGVEHGSAVVDESSYHSSSNNNDTSGGLPDELEYFDEMGRECAEAALGVDFLLNLPEATAMLLLAQLSYKSGAPGPLLLDDLHRLERELASRTPWQDNMVFAAELRIRLPPGFTVDETSDDTMLSDKGLMGPASSVAHHLWRMGSCDPHTSFSVDLALSQSEIPNEITVDQFGTVALKPVIQMCFAYTRVVQENNEYRTVRLMRIHSCRVPLAKNTETLYAHVDPEALAVVLFHKLALASIQDGLAEARNIAQEWIQSTLVCVYRSAQAYEKLDEERKEVNKKNLRFVASERLLNRDGGEMTSEEILLAQGHDRLRPIPLMVYLLLQCDALRLGNVHHSLRLAALFQMIQMSPITLTRCIAPRISLWAAGRREREPILDIIDLRWDAIETAIKEYSGVVDGLILFLDSPHQILVADAIDVVESKQGLSRTSRSLERSDALEHAIKEAAQSYRVPPDVVIEVEPTIKSSANAYAILSDALIEDFRSHVDHKDFSEWKSDVAGCVQEELQVGIA